MPPNNAFSLNAGAESRSTMTSVVLYESATTRVYRFGDPSTADSIVCKEYRGAQTTHRLDNEKALLARLQGIEGVAQLAHGAHRPDVLALRDDGAITLAQVLQAGKCDVATVVSLGSQLARTLIEVHRAGVIHRDINPANILLSPSNATVLIDFDLGVPAEQHVSTLQNGEIVGTLAYLAPEQTGRTGHAVDQRADLYALGATLYEMATGKVPFEAQDTLQLIHHHLVRAPVAPSQVNPRVPRELSDIILLLLAKAPEQRYQSAEGLLHDLERLREELAHEGGGGFVLGERDFPARLEPPEQLVGRDAECAVLRAAFDQAMNTPHRTVLVEGVAGVGKSALIKDLRPVVSAAGGWFVYGKVDQYQRDATAAGAFTQALRALGRMLLTEPKDELDGQRQRILQTLGRNTALITQILPEFDLLLGGQPAMPEVDPRQAESRFLQTAMDLLGAIASPQRPVVIVLDDLQWAGLLSLRMFERIMNAPTLRGLLMVGVYRGSELGPANALGPLLQQWGEQETPPLFMVLKNLSAESTGELVGRMLRLPRERASELGQAVGVLTGGNPFDTVEMLNALRMDGALNLGSQGWQWEATAIRRFVGRNNVVDLLAIRIGRLPSASRRLLEAMSCLGASVELGLLRAGAGVNAAQLEEQLRAPMEDGLLVADPATPGVVSFRHDRVQQAVLAVVGEVQRRHIQLELARRLVGKAAYEHHAAQLYLDCVHMLAEPYEQRHAAELFHAAAVQLAGIADHALAERYLTAARTLLAAPDIPADAALSNAVEAQLHIALYSLGRLEEMDTLYAAIQARTVHALDLLEPACLRIRSLDMRGRTADSLDLGLRMLTQLGLTVPIGYDDPTTSQRLDALGEWVRQDSRMDLVVRPQIHDRRLLAIAKLLNRMVRSAYIQGDRKALVWLLLECQRLWAEHGPSPDLVVALCRMTVMLIKERQDHRTGFEILRHVVAVGEALGYEPQTSEARAIFASYSCSWFEPLETAYQHSVRAFQGVQAGGDISLSCFARRASVLILLDIAPTIDTGAGEIDAGLALCERARNNHAAALFTCERQVLRALRGKTATPGSLDDDQFNEQAFEAQLADMPYVGLVYHTRRALHAMLLGDVAALNRHATNGLSLMGGEPLDLDIRLPVALARAWQVQQRGSDSSIDTAALLAELESCRSWLAGRAADQPYNFLHLLLLVEAEQAWALGDLWKAVTSFDAAVLEAESRERPWHRALITERAGMFHLARGMAGTGQYLLAKARDHYQAWGATAKVAQMQSEHEFLRNVDAGIGQDTIDTITAGHSVRGGSGGVSAAALDLVGVLRASQALSSETSLEQLTARVTEVLAALTGASKVLVLSWNEGQWWLQAPAPGEPSMSVTQAADQGLLPLSVVGYAERTGETLIVDDAPRDDRFARDPYFAGVPLCSLLVVPIAGQGAARAMLLLENRLGREAFNAQRLDAVMLIAGQLAVSLANAQLYESLEQRVQARTHELQETQAQLVATARRAGKAEIANNVLHNVGNVLNSVNVSASVVRRAISDSRVDGLARAVALMNDHAHELGRFMDTDPRGKALLAYLNELVDALRMEQVHALDDLDRLARSVEHISHVVAAQQTHAGSSSMLETARPQDLVEEALHLSAESISRFGVAVERRYEEVPAMALDGPRVLQILVNIIANAAQAMQGLPEGARQLTLETGLVRSTGGEGGDRLLITVRDQGEGIAPENLTRIFAHGFTTRKDGHGFGLHASALAAVEMGGRLTVHSDGPGQGAVFTLELPFEPSAPVQAGA